MPVKVAINNLQKTVPIPLQATTKLVKKILSILNVDEASISIAFVTNRKIQALNKRYLGKDRPTDVLAFDLSDGGSAGIAGKKSFALEGEVIISMVTAYENSRQYKTNIYEELALYMAHGILHLIGFDDHNESDRRRMRSKEREVVGKLKADILNISKNKTAE